MFYLCEFLVSYKVAVVLCMGGGEELKLQGWRKLGGGIQGGNKGEKWGENEKKNVKE